MKTSQGHHPAIRGQFKKRLNTCILIFYGVHIHQVSGISFKDLMRCGRKDGRIGQSQNSIPPPKQTLRGYKQAKVII